MGRLGGWLGLKLLELLWSVESGCKWYMQAKDLSKL